MKPKKPGPDGVEHAITCACVACRRDPVRREKLRALEQREREVAMSDEKKPLRTEEDQEDPYPYDVPVEHRGEDCRHCGGGLNHWGHTVHCPIQRKDGIK